MVIPQQSDRISLETWTLSSFAALLSAAQFDEFPSMPQEQHVSLSKMLSLWPPGSTRCKFPSMSLKNSSFNRKMGNQLKDVASMNLAMPITATPEDVHTVPSQLLHNLCDSFMSLVDSRLRSSTYALLQKAQTMDEWKAQEMLMVTKMLWPRKGPGVRPAVISTAVTTFRTLAPTSNQIDQNTTYNAASPQSKEVILPIIFEAGIDLRLHGTVAANITIHAAGSLSGLFSTVMHSLLSEVEISMDTTALLDSLMNSARKVVKQIIAIAVGLAHTEIQLCRMATQEKNIREDMKDGKDLSFQQVGLDVKKASHTSSYLKCEGDDESVKDDEIARPRRMSELSEFQAEPSSTGGRNNFLVDLNSVDDSTDESGLPRIRIGDLYNILNEEQNQNSRTRSSPRTSVMKRTSNVLCNILSSDDLTRSSKKRVSFSTFPQFQH